MTLQTQKEDKNISLSPLISLLPPLWKIEIIEKNIYIYFKGPPAVVN